MANSKSIFQTSILKSNADHLALNGFEIRLLPTMKGGDLSHCTLPAGKTSSPVVHYHVDEIWYVLEGEGEVWRKSSGTEKVVSVSTRTSMVIPPGTAFQFRNTDTGPLCYLIVSMPT